MLTSFRNMCVAKGFSDEYTFELFVNGLDWNELPVPVDVFLARGADLQKLLESFFVSLVMVTLPCVFFQVVMTSCVLHLFDCHCLFYVCVYFQIDSRLGYSYALLLEECLCLSLLGGVSWVTPCGVWLIVSTCCHTRPILEFQLS